MKKLKVETKTVYRWWRKDEKDIQPSHVTILKEEADGQIALGLGAGSPDRSQSASVSRTVSRVRPENQTAEVPFGSRQESPQEPEER